MFSCSFDNFTFLALVSRWFSMLWPHFGWMQMCKWKTEPEHFLTVASHCCVCRNAEASPRTRHAQLLLPVSWRSRTDHATAGMVSQTDKSKSMPSWFHVNKEQLLSCLFTSDAHWHSVSCVCTEWRNAGLQQQQRQQQPTQGGLPLAVPAVSAAASATPLLCVPSTCQTHHHIHAPA